MVHSWPVGLCTFGTNDLQVLPSSKEILHFKGRIIGDGMGFSTVPAAGAGVLTSYLHVSLVPFIKKVFDMSSHMLGSYCHALFNDPQKELYEQLFRWLHDLVKPLRSLTKFGRSLFLCCIWAMSSRPMSSQSGGHFCSTCIFDMMLSFMV